MLAVSKSGDKRVLAKRKPVQGKAVKTTIDPDIQQATADALGAQYGGVAVLDAKSGDVRALAGLAFSAPQPPGSTMKIVTASAALEDGVADLDTSYPQASSATVGGREIGNAYNEVCGGTLIESFAESCNSVFAPLGAKIGPDKLLDMAKKFGFNSPPALYDEQALQLVKPPSSSLPDPLGDELDAAVSAIGQGEVLATPLEMASVAQTIANGGVREPTSIVKDPKLKSDQKPVKAISPGTAKEVKKMMIEVVNSGTGTAGSIPQAQVAAKTGTAELASLKDGSSSSSNDPNAQPEHNVDAWFSAFAPADKPKYVVAVMIVNADGDGGTVAAPIASSDPERDHLSEARPSDGPGLEVELDLLDGSVGRRDLQVERAVLLGGDRQREEQERALDGSAARGRVDRRVLAVGGDLRARLQSEDALRGDRREDLSARIDDAVVVGEAVRLVGVVLDAEEDREVVLVGRGRGLTLQVGRVLGVRGVQEPGELDVVGQVPDFERLALEHRLLVTAAGGDCPHRECEQSDEQGWYESPAHARAEVY